MKKIVLFLLPLLFCAACDFNPSHPEFTKLEKIRIEKLTARKVVVTGDAILHNPNPFGIKVTNSDIDVTIEQKHKAKVTQLKETTINANADFPVNIEFSFSPKDIFNENLLGTALSILGNKSVRAHFKGTITVDVQGVKVPVPLDFEREIKLEK